MVILNIKGKVSSEDKENARIDRDRSSNPASSDPGMDDIDWDVFGDSGSSGGTGSWGGTGGDSGGGFGGSGGFGDSSGGFGGGGGFGSSSGSSGFGDSWGQQSSGFGGGAFGQEQPPKKDEDFEDKLFNGIGKGFKGFFSFTKDFTGSFKTFNYMSQLKMGRVSLITGGLIAVIGLVLTLFGFGGLGIQMMIGGLVALGVGVIVFMIAYDTFNKNGGADSLDSHAIQDSSVGSEALDEAPSWGSDDTVFGEDEDFTFDDDADADEDEFDIFGDDDEDEDEYSFDGDDDDVFGAFDQAELEDPEEITQRMESSLETLDNNNGMYTRQFLFEKIDNVLLSVNKTFDKTRELSETSDEFDSWDAIVRNSANLFKPNGNDVDMPYVISAKEKIFYYLIEVKRVKWLKSIDQFVNEIVSICGYNEETGQVDTSIYGVHNTVGDKIYVKIMKGDTAMVSIKDAYDKISAEVKDTKNVMPIVLGLDAEGNIVWRDFKDINSILVTGMPRSGKTWGVQSIITQMAFYMKPSELHIHILDPKAQISDYRAMKLPHIRKFVTSDATILEELRHIVRVEGPRRKEIIGGAGFVNINDYKKKNPDAEMPLLYVVIDEVITLAERMDKDTKDEFQALLLELVSQLPALGIRIFMIPHVVKDQILKKSITDLIPCRISVRGNAEHIEKSVGVKNFKHKLVHQGDMAVKFNNDEAMFIHSAILTTSNEGNQELFDFLTKFWRKLDPEGFEGSLLWQEETGFKNRKLIGRNSNLSNDTETSVRQAHKVDITLDTGDNSSSKIVQGNNRKLSNSEVTALVSKVNTKDDDDEILDLFD